MAGFELGTSWFQAERSVVTPHDPIATDGNLRRPSPERRDRSSRYFREMDRPSPSGSFEDIEASWSRKPQQFEARRKKEKARQSSMACYHVVVLVFLFILTAGVAYLVYNGTDTSSFLRDSPFGALLASKSSCSQNPCKNGGTCMEGPYGYLCTCAEGWTGKGCEAEMFCATQPCKNDGLCLEGTNSFYCFCQEGWNGKQCDADIDECKTDPGPCGEDGQCTNTLGSYTCSCADGYAGVPCKDVNECEVANDCDANANCTNIAGSYKCTCNSGYTGNGKTCQDVNECDTGFDRCPTSYECVNTPGSFNCSCPDGFTDTGTGCVLETTALPLTSTALESTRPSTSGHETSTISLTSTSAALDSTGTATSDHETTTVSLTTASEFTGPTQTTVNSGPTTAAPTTTVEPTTPEPTAVISWVSGKSVTEYSGWIGSEEMVEEISDAANHTGNQSWYYARGWNSGQPGGGTPFSPGLKVKVGRSDGSYTGDVDSFYASFWFKMAKDYGNRWGDGTRIMIAAGDPNGTTASSNHLEINFPKSYRAKLSVRTKESHPSYTQCAQTKDCGDDFGYSYTDIADDLDPTTWHHVQMTLRTHPQDYADQWSYLIDNTHSHTGGAFYKTGQYDEGRYLYVNRLNFASFKTPTDNAIKGIYFDDITYRAFDSSDPDLIHHEYSTSFEP
ncbi:hypothetical protein Bbelb_260430 [Branchiostoma belcheri]|nr:hypothetical protein Bbelb_260430 [Branchiostoma belcheri]